MTSEHWRKAKEIFNAAIEQPVAERSRFLAAACAGDEALQREIENLLKANDETGSFMKPPFENLAVALSGESLRFSAGKVLSHYRIIAPIGAGGMGEVYLAQDTKLERRAALKINTRNVSSSVIGVATVTISEK